MGMTVTWEAKWHLFDQKEDASDSVGPLEEYLLETYSDIWAENNPPRMARDLASLLIIRDQRATLIRPRQYPVS